MRIDIINLDVTMYYHEFQTADGRLNRYPRGNPTVIIKEKHIESIECNFQMDNGSAHNMVN